MTTITTAIATLNKELSSRRRNGGAHSVRSHFKWLMMWAADLRVGRTFAQSGHWAAEGLTAAAYLVEMGILRGRPVHWEGPI